MPGDFLKPSGAARQIVSELRSEYRFFHWELEFPDVFRSQDSGFHAVIGNPPWDTVQPVSKEFFSNFDPLYRSYGKEEARERQTEYFQHSATIESHWLSYNASFKAVANWMKNVADPGGEHSGRASCTAYPTYCDPNHPFRHQGGGKPYTYRMFLEASHALLCEGGRLGMLVPSGVYSDQGSGDLRRLFLEAGRWSHLYVFQNERFVFKAIHHSFKIAAVFVEKKGPPGALAARFRLGPGNSPEAHELEADIVGTDYIFVDLAQIRRFSPTSGSILETCALDDLKILERLYDRGVLLGDLTGDCWQIEHQQGEFNISSKAKLFPPRKKWEDAGYRSDQYGHWLKGPWAKHDGSSPAIDLVVSADAAAAIRLDEVEDVALPLYQGGMINQFDFSASGYLPSEGRRGFKWNPVPWDEKRIEPQFLISRADYVKSETCSLGRKVVFRNIARTTDSRTFIGTLINSLPTCNSIGVLHSVDSLLLSAALNSLVMDWSLRQRLAGTNLSYFVLQDLVAPRPSQMSTLTQVCARLTLGHVRFAQEWMDRKQERKWRELWALTPHERLRCRVILEATIASLYGLNTEDFRRILLDCSHPIPSLETSEFVRRLDPRGFWRFQNTLLPEHRLTVISQIAFQDLKSLGLEKFLNQNDGEGWMLPEYIRLADYGLGSDDRAKEDQPVAAALGPRLYPWQSEQSIEDSWAECAHHAEILENLLPRQDSKKGNGLENVSHPLGDLFGNPIETDLFGNPIYVKSRKR